MNKVYSYSVCILQYINWFNRHRVLSAQSRPPKLCGNVCLEQLGSNAPCRALPLSTRLDKIWVIKSMITAGSAFRGVPGYSGIMEFGSVSLKSLSMPTPTCMYNGFTCSSWGHYWYLILRLFWPHSCFFKKGVLTCSDKTEINIFFADIPDDFFEVTENDVRRLWADLQRQKYVDSKWWLTNFKWKKLSRLCNCQSMRQKLNYSEFWRIRGHIFISECM